MDSFCEMEYSEEKTSRSKISKSPTLSIISEEQSVDLSSVSGEATTTSNKKRSALNAQSCKLALKRKLFDANIDNMDTDFEESSSVDSTPPSENQSPMQPETPSKKKKYGNILAESSCAKTMHLTLKKEKPSHKKYNVDHSCKRVLSTEENGGSSRLNDKKSQFDMLFVTGIFNTVKPATLTSQDFHELYINDSSDGENVPAPKKTKPKKKIGQSKLSKGKQSPQVSGNKYEFK